MSKLVLKELPELIKDGIIDDATASRIEHYYQTKTTSGAGKLLIVFGILGALMVGLGIILIIAHNWDSFPKAVRLLFAFFPLAAGQGVAVYLIVKNSKSVAYREASGAFLIMAIGAAISLVSQIYNIQGDFGKFLFVWIALSLPVIYVLNSSVASLLVWIGATAFAFVAGLENSVISVNYYLLVTAVVLPYFVNLIRKHPGSNFAFFHHWIVPASLALSFFSLDETGERLMFVSYAGLFGIFIVISQLDWLGHLKLIANGWAVIGTLGTLWILLVNTFQQSEWFYRGSFDIFLGGVIVLYLTGVFFLIRTRKFTEINQSTFWFPIFSILFLIGINQPEITRILINLMVLALSVSIVLEGSKKNDLGTLNYGLLILSILIICRFFDVDLSFVVRGILFICVGAGFFIFNYRIIKKNKGS